MKNERLLLRVNETADVLGVSKSKVYDLIGQGILPAIKVGSTMRVPVAGLERWIESQKLVNRRKNEFLEVA